MVFIIFVICWILNELDAPWWIWALIIIGYAAKVAYGTYQGIKR